MSLNAIFDYEFYFNTDDIIVIDKFNTIYNECNLEDPSGNRRSLIYDNILSGFRYFKAVAFLAKTFIQLIIIYYYL
jgi:hypothetical protein